jgi:PAS domain S-box-containing protein/putative nucleotidyltransferase with HDIG domain
VDPTRKLLIVEDNPGDARLIVEMLRDCGANVAAETLDTLAAAIDRLAVADVDIALLDLGLPDSQGLETFARLRDAASGVAIIVLTGNSDTGLGIRAVQEGAQDFLVKGKVDGELLTRAIAYAIERKRVEKALRLSEEKYASAFHASPDSITITRLNDGKLVEVNEGYEQLLGYTRAESIGKTTAELSAYADPGTRDRLVTRLREAGEVKDFDATVRRKDGTSAAVIVSARLLEFQGEECFLAVTRDVTERRRMEEEQSRAERFFRDTFEHADVGIAHVNCTDGTWLRVNQRLCDLLGYTREELLQTTFAAITHPDDVEENVKHLRRLLAGEEETYAADKRYLRKDGSIVWVHMNVALIRKEDGTPDYNITVVTDITERMRAEGALRESEEKFRDLFNNAEVGMFRTKLDGSELLDLNHKYLEILGYAREELIGKPSVIVWADPREREAMTRTLEETGRVVGLEFDLLTKQGDVRRCLTSLRLYRDTGILEGSITDITERKRAEELAARQTERIERTLTSVIDIAGSIGEVRDPYTAGHQKRVAELAARIAQDLGMSDREVADIRVAGLLHDMGKAGVPTEILGKPGAISPTEFELIKAHAEAGYRIAVSANMEEPIPELIYQHHERCDGSGYPRGLLRDQMLAGAKVLAVADVVEAMMSHRPYRPALGIEAAMAEIERGAGSHYDAEVSKACLALFREGAFEFSS